MPGGTASDLHVENIDIGGIFIACLEQSYRWANNISPHRNKTQNKLILQAGAAITSRIATSNPMDDHQCLKAALGDDVSLF